MATTTPEGRMFRDQSDDQLAAMSPTVLAKALMAAALFGDMNPRHEVAYRAAFMTVTADMTHAENVLEPWAAELQEAFVGELAKSAQARHERESAYVTVQAMGPTYRGVPKRGDLVLISNAGTARKPGRFGYSRTEVLAVAVKHTLGTILYSIRTRAFGQSPWTNTGWLVDAPELATTSPKGQGR